MYIVPMLLFGLRSAPKLFNAVADALEWYVHQQGVENVFHYLDDFIVLGAPNSQECTASMATLDRSCAHLGVLVAEHKRDGPTTCLTFLGIEIDTQVGQLRLPAERPFLTNNKNLPCRSEKYAALPRPPRPKRPVITPNSATNAGRYQPH